MKEIKRFIGIAALLVALAGGGCANPTLRTGWQALVAEDYDGAIPVLLQAVGEDPDDWKPRMYLGLAYAETNAQENARGEWVAALNRTHEDRFWNQVVEVMEAYGLDNRGERIIGEPADMSEKRTAAKIRIAKEDPGTRHVAKFFWWGVVAVLVGTSIMTER